MKIKNFIIRGLSLIGIAASVGFKETDENVLSIIDDVMSDNKNTGIRSALYGDMFAVRKSMKEGVKRYQS